MTEKNVFSLPRGGVKDWLLSVYGVGALFIIIAVVVVAVSVHMGFIGGGNQYCFAFWAPHGGFWQDVCYDTARECNDALAERRQISPNVNTRFCYRPKQTIGYCVGHILTGYVRYDDFDDTEYQVTTEICTRTERQCQEYAKYQDPDYAGSPDVCEKTIVNTRQGEGSYLSTKAELKSIVKNNTRNALVENAVEDGKTCVKYRAAKDQRRAFEKLGLDWARTNKWGAFVDTDGILRANKPSCREIRKGTYEYVKYMK